MGALQTEHQAVPPTTGAVENHPFRTLSCADDHELRRCKLLWDSGWRLNEDDVPECGPAEMKAAPGPAKPCS